MNDRASKKCYHVETIPNGFQCNSIDFMILYQFEKIFWIDLKYTNIIFWRNHLKKSQIKRKHYFGAAASKMKFTYSAHSQRNVVSNIFFKNRLQRGLTKFNFLTTIIKVSNISYFWRIFRNIYQNISWPVNIFAVISWSKVK